MESQIKPGHNLITSEKIADGSVSTADLANNSVTAAKLDTGLGIWPVIGGNVFRPSGFVGIGKQPAVALDVSGAIAATGNITAGGAVTASSFYSNALARMSIFASGIVGIGTGNALDRLHVAGGAMRIDDTRARYIRMYRSAGAFIIAGNLMPRNGGGFSRIQWDGDGNWDQSSDRTLKMDITGAEPVLDRLMRLPVRHYHWKDRPSAPVKSFGVIAQEVQPLFPDIVVPATKATPLRRQRQSAAPPGLQDSCVEIPVSCSRRRAGRMAQASLQPKIRLSTRRFRLTI